MATTETEPVQASAGKGRGLVLVCLAGVLWGTIGPAIPVVHEASDLSPLTIGGYRALFAMVVLVIAAAVMRRLRDCARLGRRHWRRVTVVGVSTAIFQLFFFVAVLWTGVSITTVVCLGFAPVLLLITGSVRRRRRPSAGQFLTVAVAVAGLLLVSVLGSPVGEAPYPVLGVFAALVSGAAYALSAEAAAPLSLRLDTLTMTTTTTCVAAMVLVPVGLVIPWASGEGILTTDLGSWALIGYLGAVTMALAYALLFAGLRTTPSGAVVVATLLEPVTAVVIAVVFLGERLTVAGVVGVVLIMAAIGSLGRHSKEPAPQ
ncbi:drug/metabolite transporter, DME family [Amycolatopsis lurida]|uniref:Multidrug DMT transporter permease n=1 Tax=Amycolatopsis lurida NRRL 2430 TaxID=1460371 RepID=A0A2P2FYS8_AMYLU|nr:DMT family transporter [Amycolatopsis lurida]KFU81890.1 multidrug DMT transporter permease [Amycolatopsis lurida NRRL 2430]SEB32251.1 drug/metabolite transporter, DME family [Amycolatopsis lurida]